jgi:prepilin-type N-terminal cleavage/methylation domain-containing protein
MQSRGFTLVELVIVVLVVAIILTAAAPRVLEISRGAATAAEIASLHAAENAIYQYQNLNSAWPEDCPAGEFPPELTGYLNDSFFTSVGLWGASISGPGPKVLASGSNS